LFFLFFVSLFLFCFSSFHSSFALLLAKSLFCNHCSLLVLLLLIELLSSQKNPHSIAILEYGFLKSIAYRLDQKR